MDSSSQQVILPSVNTLQDYDDKLKTITEELKRVQYKRNLHVPICRLPSEILGSIFTFHTESCSHDDRRTSSRRHRARVWIDILLVCRLWCSVAYNTPSMWSTPDFMYPKLARSVLKHSKSSPLNVCWDFFPTYLDADHREVFIEAMSRPARIASLNIQAYSEDTRGFLEGLLEKMNEPAPLIRSVRIAAIETASIALPPDFLAGDAPRLKELEIVQCLFPWKTPLVGNLTQLQIKRLPIDNQLSVNDIFEVLQRAPSLEIVHLDNCLSPNRACLPSDSSVVELPHLSSLSVSIETEACCTLLRHMSFPDTAKLHFESKLPATPDGDFSPLFAYISGLLTPTLTSSDHPRTIKSLKMNIYKRHGHIIGKFLAWNTGSGVIEDLVDTQTPHLCVELETVDHTVRELMPRILALGPLVHLESFTLNSSESPSPDMILQCFGNSNRLETMFLVNHAPFEFVKCLSKNLTPAKRKPRKRKSAGKGKSKRRQKEEEEEEEEQVEEEAAIPQPALFPALKTLGMVDVDFREESRTLLKPLLTALKLRSEHGCPLDKVVLEECIRLFGPDVEKIEKRVDVEWDGCEIEEDEEDNDDFYDDDDDVLPPLFPFPFLPNLPTLGFYSGGLSF
ncbi:hypothetical protein L218DRAFT_136201 [Marasmius fiardii PR-910]|nr:hypothetical protein L218DRAFT_136201 [Marasmius fiardii PR-910]